MAIERLKDHCTEETLLPKWKLVRIEQVGSDQMYVPTEIEKGGKDEFSLFVVKIIVNLNDQLDNLNEVLARPISRYNRHGGLRPKREITEQRKQHIKWEELRRQIPHLLNVLCGREKLPVKFQRASDGEIIGFEIHLPNGLEPSLSQGPQISS